MNARAVCIACLTAGAYLSEANALEVDYGAWDIQLRYRVEQVDDSLNKDALASTLRVATRFTTKPAAGFSLTAELEHIEVIGSEKFNDGGTNGKTRYAVVADPGGTEFNQAYLQYAGLPETTIRVGRQEITHRKTPTHRFVGNVLWRQNHQSFDGWRIQTNAIPRTQLELSGIHNVNRIFGEDNDLPNRSDFDIDAELLRAVHTIDPRLVLEGYYYNLDFDDAIGLSARTTGLNVSGSIPVNEQLSLRYAVEVARQRDIADNPNGFSLAYHAAQIGFSVPGANNLKLGLSWERLEGDGTNGFQTPLATLHAYQGWGDQFLSTPASGLVDMAASVGTRIKQVSLTMVYHQYDADEGGEALGNEWNLQATTSIGDRTKLGLKYSRFDAASNATTPKRDVNKAWFWVQYDL